LSDNERNLSAHLIWTFFPSLVLAFAHLAPVSSVPFYNLIIPGMTVCPQQLPSGTAFLYFPGLSIWIFKWVFCPLPILLNHLPLPSVELVLCKPSFLCSKLYTSISHGILKYLILLNYVYIIWMKNANCTEVVLSSINHRLVSADISTLKYRLIWV
jgi:hypothetical protein